MVLVDRMHVNDIPTGTGPEPPRVSARAKKASTSKTHRCGQSESAPALKRGARFPRRLYGVVENRERSLPLSLVTSSNETTVFRDLVERDDSCVRIAPRSLARGVAPGQGRRKNEKGHDQRKKS